MISFDLKKYLILTLSEGVALFETEMAKEMTFSEDLSSVCTYGQPAPSANSCVI